MRFNLLTLCMVLAGLLLPIYSASAGVITSSGPPSDKHDNPYKAIIYQNLSHNPVSLRSFTTQNLVNSPYLNRYPLPYLNKYPLTGSTGSSSLLPTASRRQLSGFTLDNSNPEATYISGLARQNGPAAGENLNGDMPDVVIDAFLDKLKNDSSLRTIYFTSKDLVFNYRRQSSNILQLGFNMIPDDYKNYRSPWQENPNETEITLRGKEKNNLQQQAGILFGLISKSYKNIFYILLALSAALYICFRYILNKYI